MECEGSRLLPCTQATLGQYLAPAYPVGLSSQSHEGQEVLLSTWSVESPDSPELWLLGSHQCPAFLKGIRESQGAGEVG